MSGGRREKEIRMEKLELDTGGDKLFGRNKRKHFHFSSLLISPFGYLECKKLQEKLLRI